MSKICILNTAVNKDSAGAPFDSTIALAPQPPNYSKPVRVLGAEQCAIEILFTGSYSGASFELRWWREFWNDDLSKHMDILVPNVRVITGIDPDVPWSQEVVDVAAVDGSISNEPAERKTTLIIPANKPGVGVWIPVKVFAPWMRIAMYAPAQVVPGPGDIGDGVYNVLMNVHVGGHPEDDYLDDPTNNNMPYAYDARAGSIL